MRNIIRFRDGREVNLSGGVDAEAHAELEATQGRGSRRDPLLFCGGCGGGVYIRHCITDPVELSGVHFDRNGCPEALKIRKRLMSDEHKRMQDYTVRAADDGGFPADTEVRTVGRTVVDVVIDRRIGVEIQRSRLTAGAAVDRTRRSVAAGLETVAWVAERTGVEWAGRVPGFQWLDNGQLRVGIPRPRTVRSRGVMTFRAERGDWRSQHTPVPEALALPVDDAVCLMAAGAIRPVMYGGYVRLVREEGLRLYTEMTGISLPSFTGHALPPPLSRSRVIDCGRPKVRHPKPPAAEPYLTHRCEAPEGCDDSPFPYENGAIWLCAGHARQRYSGRRTS